MSVGLGRCWPRAPGCGCGDLLGGLGRAQRHRRLQSRERLVAVPLQWLWPLGICSALSPQGEGKLLVVSVQGLPVELC